MAGEALGSILSYRLSPPDKVGWIWQIQPGVRVGGSFVAASLNKNETFSTSDLNDVGGAGGPAFLYNGSSGFGAYGEFLLVLEGVQKGPEPGAPSIDMDQVAKSGGKITVKRNVQGTERTETTIETQVDPTAQTVERCALFGGLRYEYQRSGWVLANRPDGLTSSEATQSNKVVAFTAGFQYDVLSIGAAFVVNGTAVFDAAVSADQSRGLAVTGVPVPREGQKYPIVQGLSNQRVGLSGWDLFFRYNLSKYFDLSLTLSRRKTDPFTDTYADRTITENPPDDTRFVVEAGATF